MKILVVEDNAEKLRHVVNVLQQVSGCDMETIDTAHDALEAKRKLREESYDFLVLDVALPERADKEASPDGGMALLKEVLERDIYNKPREIVGLTAFSEVRERVGPEFAQDLWDVIQYEPFSDLWADQLKRKVRYIQMALKPGVQRAYQSSLCVITALPEPEFTALKKLPWEFAPLEVTGDGTMYWKGKYTHAHQSHSVIAACAPRMGMTASAVLCSKMIQNFAPKYIGIVGIAAGVRGACNLGDIIAADPVWDWGSGKRYVEGGSPVFAASPHQLGLSSYVRGKLAAMASRAQLFDEIRRNWPGTKPETTLSMRLGPVASGASVLADGSVTETIKQQHRKVIGVEMEAYGVFGAADEAPLPPPKAFALKSVCDFADEEKSDEFQAYAAYTSASALKIFMEEYLP
jgi:nucleoside phosphorylase/CheY-like chemotaxis protein